MAKSKLYVNTTLSGEKIETLLADFKNADKQNKQAVNDTLNALAQEIVMNAKFLAPAKLDKEPQTDEEGNLVMQPGSSLSFLLLDNGKGQRFMPAFTSNEELGKMETAAGQYCVQLGFDDFAALIVDKGGLEGMVINPYGANFLLNRNTISQWREKKQIAQTGHAQHVITPDTPVELSTPNPYPLQMSNKICDAAKELPVSKLWLRNILLDGAEGYLLVVEYKGERNEIFGKLADAAKPFLGKKSLHIVALDEGFGGKATEGVLPVYEKE